MILPEKEKFYNPIISKYLLGTYYEPGTVLMWYMYYLIHINLPKLDIIIIIF